jgi:hypothetical protein
MVLGIVYPLHTGIADVSTQSVSKVLKWEEFMDQAGESPGKGSFENCLNTPHPPSPMLKPIAYTYRLIFFFERCKIVQ